MPLTGLHWLLNTCYQLSGNVYKVPLISLTAVNPLIATLKPHSNGPLYRNTVIGTLTVDGWVGCYIWYNEEGPGRAAAPPSPLLAVPPARWYSSPIHRPRP